MTRTKLIGALAFMFCSTAVAKPGGAAWDEKAAAEIKSVVEKFMDAWNKQDMATVKATIAEDMWGAWDLDMAMQPIAWANKAEMNKFFDEAMAGMKKMGATVSWKTTHLDCKASGALGVCFVEGQQTMTMPNMPPMMVTLRNTEVLAKDKGAWKFVQHHGSVAKEPPMPPKMMAYNAKTATGWMDAPPEMPGIKMIPLWMNPANMTSATLMKATQTWKQPRHMHPYPFTFSVLEGTIVTSDANGKDVEYGPGSVIYRAAGEPHQTTIKAGAVMLSVGSGPMMSIPVDEKGQPVQHAQN